MTNNSASPIDPQNLWQEQPMEAIPVSLEDIRRKAGKFHNKIIWRNAREYLAALAVVLFFGFEAARAADSLMRAGFGLSMAGLVYLAWQLYRRGSPRSVSAEMGTATGIDFFQRELARQRDLVGNAWRWYLGPLIPGWVVLMAGVARHSPGHVRHFWPVFVGYNLLAAAVFVFVWRLNQRAADRLQEKIDELDRLR